MGRDGDERLRDWSGRQPRSQRARGECDGNSSRKGEPKVRDERLHRNTSQPRGDTDGQHASRHDGSKARSSHGNDL